mmetsp:Transcript_33356/g.60111  ORF Transcript_33356/g.60111 Transcript_33356/m.60111 type:complete len:315 (-) Transcript_33356:125-1069(-)|eukprot:CAMPEP_0201881314 /NCGR_PEP_ID=MMETSP0902-20130614/11656_1 /ASSEMBLY_ACC=CAM_ASM_000551 /TAXON_ID=420261 /ORGANISM="Thalassiosira antarctica, Strain CCMP982" /LENGTH=314 /DNA_ID=CAMNT_0048409491 /DNA_START=183 /DNA_END=1127 /DNA_ORIENTATION=+
MSSPWFDPRLTVFIIWGVFVVLFICIPSKRIVQRIFNFIGCSCCGYEEEIAPTNNGGHEVHYELLSTARKQELDSLRASHITYRLHPVSLTLEKKHMLRRISDTESPTAPQNNELPQDRITDPVDVETGFTRGMDPPERDEEEENGQEGGVQYTHVLIPKPGHNFDCVDVHNSETCPEDHKKPNEEKKPKNRIFGAKGKEGAKEMKEEPKTTDSNEKGERRSCSIFCAICLMEYETSERVSWSSNPACTHVFHEDCVVQWLVALGKTKSKMQRYSEAPTEAQLLNYQLECPCCRQEFISRGQAELPDICGEESV